MWKHRNHDSLHAAAAALMAASEIPVVREREGRTRTVNVRPFLHELAFLSMDTSTGRTVWHAVVGIGESGNVRPAEIADALGLHLQGVKLRRAHRTRLRKSADQSPAPQIETVLSDTLEGGGLIA